MPGTVLNLTRKFSRHLYCFHITDDETEGLIDLLLEVMLLESSGATSGIRMV